MRDGQPTVDGYPRAWPLAGGRSNDCFGLSTQRSGSLMSGGFGTVFIDLSRLLIDFFERAFHFCFL